MADVDVIATLRSCPLFEAMPTDQVQALAAIAMVQRFETAQAIFHEGDPPPGMYVVAAGRVRVFKLAPNGKVHVLHLASAGQTFAEVAVLGGFAAPASAEAVEPAECVLLPAGKLSQLMQADPWLTRAMLAGLAGGVRHLVGVLEDVVLRDAVGRVARYLLSLDVDAAGRCELSAMKKDLASHLNLTSETLSRTLRRLDEAALIESDGGSTVRIVNRQALTDAADGLFPTL